MRISELTVPFANAQEIFRRLKLKYPRLDATLVVTSGYGQSELTTDGFALFDRVASMFANSSDRKELLILFDIYKELLRRNADLKSSYIKDTTHRLHARIGQLLGAAEIVESSQINLIFGDLDYELISKLQTDQLVDRALTPQTSASIKICLGSLQQLRRWRAVGHSERASVHTERQKVAL